MELGEACAADVECKSGFCPADDGVCCDQACDGACEACVEAKSGADDGTCFAVLIHTDPDAECEASPMSECGPNGQGCNGDAFDSGCDLWAAGTACGDTSCQDGIVAGDVCDGEGTCEESAGTSCEPYTCADGTTCASSCDGDEDCIEGFFCGNAGACLEKRPNGDPCSGANQCTSGFCTEDDGVCCDQACDATCEACTQAKSGLADGTCGAIPDDTDPDSECLALQTCNGAGTCTL
jgi:hypothetical protein